MPSLSAVSDFVVSAYLGWGIVFLIVTALEFANSRERQDIRSRTNGLAYWMVGILASFALTKVLVSLWTYLGVTPLMELPLLAWVAWSGPLAAILAAFLAAMIHDFVFYWYHRIQHRWLWRWHAVHHSIEDLNAVNSYHHLSEAVMSLLLMQLPLSLIAPDVGPILPWATLFVWCHVIWIHSPTRINLGPLRVILADNRFHRIHHSLEERHFDKNFGAFTTLWDRLFGTCHMPAKGEWPAVGLSGVSQPNGMREWLDLPLRYGRGNARISRDREDYRGTAALTNL